MKIVLFLIYISLSLFVCCSNSFNKVKYSSIDNLLSGIENLNHDFNTSLAIAKFNKDFADVNNNFKVVSTIENTINKNNKWKTYSNIKSIYDEKGRVIRTIDTLTTGGIRDSKEEYIYKNNLIVQVNSTNTTWNNELQYFKKVYNYNNQEKIEAENEYYKENNIWKNSSQYFYSYDSIGKLSEFVWKNNYKEKYYYEKDSTIVFQYKGINNKYELYRKTDFLFNHKGDLVKEIIYELNNSVWNIIKTLDRKYDYKGDEIEETYYNYKYNSFTRNKYKYNSQNQRIIKKSAYYTDKDLSNEISVRNEQYNYQNDLLSEYVINNFVKYNFYYDDNNFIKSIMIYSYDADKKSFVEATRISQTYYKIKPNKTF